MLRRFFIVGMLLLVAAAMMVAWRILTLPPLCGNEIVQEAVSPDGAHRAVLFQRDCGATTGFSTQVSIIGGSDDLPNDGGNVFVADGHPDQTQTELVWLDATTLTIATKARDTAPRAEGQVGGVTVRYEAR